MLEEKSMNVMEYVSKNECPEALIEFINERLEGGATLKELCAPWVDLENATSSQALKNAQDSLSRLLKKHGYIRANQSRKSPYIKSETNKQINKKEDVNVINEETKSRRGRKSKKELEELKHKEIMERINNDYPLGVFNNAQLFERVYEAALATKQGELVSIGPRLSPAAKEAAEWFENEYPHFPMYLIVDALSREFNQHIAQIKNYKETQLNIEKAVGGVKEKKQKVMRITAESNNYLKKIATNFPKFNASDVINLALITYKDYLIEQNKLRNNA